MNYSFEEFWKEYKNPVGKHKCKLKFEKLSIQDRDCIKKTINFYLKSTTVEPKKINEIFKPFRKNPLTYLNQKVWLDYEDKQDAIAKLAVQFVFDDKKLTTQEFNDLFELDFSDVLRSYISTTDDFSVKNAEKFNDFKKQLIKDKYGL